MAYQAGVRTFSYFPYLGFDFPDFVLLNCTERCAVSSFIPYVFLDFKFLRSNEFVHGCGFGKPILFRHALHYSSKEKDFQILANQVILEDLPCVNVYGFTFDEINVLAGWLGRLFEVDIETFFVNLALIVLCSHCGHR